MQRYSVAFMPPAPETAYVAQKKDLLASAICWYHSRNALAHVTVLEFELPDSHMRLATDYLEWFSSGIQPFHVIFDRIGKLGSAICFFPCIISEWKLKATMVRCSTYFPLTHGWSDVPHITIGRQLEAAKMATALQRFASENAGLSFTADGLFLRRLNMDRGQYDVVRKFDFRGHRPLATNGMQLRLFDS